MYLEINAKIHLREEKKKTKQKTTNNASCPQTVKKVFWVKDILSKVVRVLQ